MGQIEFGSSINVNKMVCGTTCILTPVFIENGTCLASKYAPLSHAHGNINNGGCIGSTSGCIVATTTSGCLTTIPSTTYQTALTNPVTGTGTANYVAKFTNTTCVGDSLIYDNGTYVSVGNPTPIEKLTIAYGHLGFTAVPAPTTPSAALAGVAGVVPNGTYCYSVTYVTSEGETTNSTLSAAVTVVNNTVNGQVNVTIPVGAVAGVTYTARKIYRASSAGYWMYYIGTVANNSSTTFTDNVATETGAALVPSAGSVSDTTTGIVFNGANRMLYAGNDTSLGIGALQGSNANTSLNVAVGFRTANAITSARYVTAMGANTLLNSTNLDDGATIIGHSMFPNLSGMRTTAIGLNSGSNATDFRYGFIGGYLVANTIQTGCNNIIIGSSAGSSATGGTQTGVNCNVIIGDFAGRRLFSNSANNVYLGYSAGRYESASNKIIIDNLDRTTEALGRTSALIYGVTHPTRASQLLTLGGGGSVILQDYGTGAKTGTAAYTLNVNAAGCIIEDAVTNGTVTSVTAGNGMTQSGTASINPTLNIVSHAGTAGSIGTINIGADAIGVNLGTGSCVAAAGNHTHATLYAPITGSTNYVQIQTACSQAGGFWINCGGRFDGDVCAKNIIRCGGTSSQFLKADGSVDSNTYLTTGTGVASFNGRFGTVVLKNTDVTPLVLSGFTTGANSTIVNTDTIEVAFEKLQGQVNARTTCTGTVTSVTVTAGNGMTGGGTVTTSGTATLDVVSATGTAGSVGLVVVAADSIGVCLGTGSCHASRGDHAHGNINNGGCVGSASGCVICTTTSGCLTAFTLPAYTTCTGTVVGTGTQNYLTKWGASAGCIVDSAAYENGSVFYTGGKILQVYEATNTCGTNLQYQTPYYGRFNVSVQPQNGRSEVRYVSKGATAGAGETYFVIASTDAANTGNNLLLGVANNRAFIANAVDYSTAGALHLGSDSWQDTGVVTITGRTGNATGCAVVTGIFDSTVCAKSPVFVENGTCLASKYAALSHAHGNINSGGCVGSTSGCLLATTTSGCVTTLASNTYAPLSHTHGSINNGGCIGSTAGCVVCTTTSGCLTVFTLPAYTTCVGTVTSVAVNSPLTGSTITTSGTFGIQKATSGQNGYLSSTDWSTFNGKTSCTGTVTSVAALTIASTGTDITSTVANGTTTPVITLCIPTASASARGVLSCADWSSFNSKTTCTGTVTSVTVGAGNGLTGGGTVTTSGTATVDVVSHAGTASSVGILVIGADSVGTCLGTGSCHAAAGNHAHGCITNTGCMSGGVSGCVLCTTTNGCITYGTITGGGITTANNGLHVDGTRVTMGGALTGNTVLSGGYSVSMPIVCSTGTTCVGTNIHMTTGTGRNICFASASATVGASLNVAAQTGAATQAGGALNICAGSGGATSGAGGNLYLVAGSTLSNAANGGTAFLCGGWGGFSGSGIGGDVCISGGGGVSGEGQVKLLSGGGLKLNTTATGICLTGCLSASCFVGIRINPVVPLHILSGTANHIRLEEEVNNSYWSIGVAPDDANIIISSSGAAASFDADWTSGNVAIGGSSISTTRKLNVVGSFCTSTTAEIGTTLNVGTHINLAAGVAHIISPICSTSSAQAFCICGGGYQGTSSTGTGGPTCIVGGPSYANIGGTPFGGSVTLIGGLAWQCAVSQPATGGFTYICGGCGCSSGGGGTGTGGGVYIVGGVGTSVCGSVYIMNGATYALCAVPASCVAINYNNSLRFATTSAGGTLTGIFCATTCGTSADWVATSDCRQKTDIKPLCNSLSIIQQLCGVCYYMCDDINHEKNVGLIAQDVELVLPEIVSHITPTEEDAKYGITDDKLGLKYDKLTAVLIEAIKEQQQQINFLTSELNNLKYKNS